VPFAPVLGLAMTETNLEREVKLGTWPGFRVPDLDGLAAWVHPRPSVEHVLDAVYYDASDLRMIRAGITLRHRTGEGPKVGRWTAKIPHPSNPDALERTELNEDGDAAEVPAPLLRVLRGVLRGASVTPVAHLHTVRQLVVLVDGGGRRLAEVADDEVSVLEEGRVAARFREVEAEVASGAPIGLLALVVERLRSAGASDADQTPKLVRALGPRALAPPDPPVPLLGPKPTAAAAIQAALSASVQRLIAHDPVVRLDLGSFGVHQARVSTRRLRSDLRTFEPLLDAPWAEALRTDLKWLADALGSVRDADVLGQRLRREADRLGRADAAQARRFLRRLTRQRTHQLAQLQALYDSDRYLDLLETLVDAARSPKLHTKADAAAKDVLPDLARGPWEKVRKAAEKLGADPVDDELHLLRIKAKRSRYACEAVARAVPAATPMAEAMAELQSVLGDQHDAVVAEAWLRAGVTAGASREQALAVGLLIAAQQAEARAGREAWHGAWDALDHKKVRAWLK
jgi:CHAD domain-containing protein